MRGASPGYSLSLYAADIAMRFVGKENVGPQLILCTLPLRRRPR
jgi:hypothetical protein